MQELTDSQRDFIGSVLTTARGNTLKVVGLHGVDKRGKSLFILECSVCSKDSELFPYGSIYAYKHNIVKLNNAPCGCSRTPRWSRSQLEVIIRRKCKEVGYDFLGFKGEWDGTDTFIKLHNPISGNTWDTTTTNSFLHAGTADPSTRKNPKIVLATELNKINNILESCGGEFLHWEGGEFVDNKTRFVWRCSEGHICTSNRINFIKGTRCA